MRGEQAFLTVRGTPPKSAVCGVGIRKISTSVEFAVAHDHDTDRHWALLRMSPIATTTEIVDVVLTLA